MTAPTKTTGPRRPRAAVAAAAMLAAAGLMAGCSAGTSTPSAAPPLPAAGAHRPHPVRGTISADLGGTSDAPR